jgi:hypothetical protein
MGTISSTYAAFWNSAISSPSLSNVALWQSNDGALTCLQSATDIRFDIAGNAVMYIEDDGASISGGLALVGSGANLTVAGNSTTAGTKSFTIDGPLVGLPEGSKLMHCTVESPFPDNQYRLLCECDEGWNTFELPSWFDALNAADGQVWCTGAGHWHSAYGVVSGNTVSLNCQASGAWNVLVIVRRVAGVIDYPGPVVSSVP